MCSFGFSQTPIITMVMDGDCTGGTPKVVEIYAQGTVDFTLYSIENQTNSNTTWGNSLDLSPLGTVTNDFVYIYTEGSNTGVFASEFPSVPTANSLDGGSTVSINGDDRVRLIETASATVIDQYGVDGTDGTGTPWEYRDGYARRVNNTGPDGSTFIQANWNFNNGAVNGLGLCQSGTDPFETLTGAGTFSFATGPTVSSSENPVTGFLQFVGTPSAVDSITVSGFNLTADITVTVASGSYEVSSDKITYSNTVTITQIGGNASNKVYIRLNGTAVANPSNGTLTLSTAGATNVTVNLEGEIRNPTPTVEISTDTIVNTFEHFVGTPSVADSFAVEGFYLTSDIDITAPTNFEVSLDKITFSSAVTLSMGTGTLSTTQVYVRLNGSTMNLNQAGKIMLTSTGADNDSVFVSGQTLAYIAADLDTLRTVDANGESPYVGDYVEVTGILYCEDFRSWDGYDLTLIDGTGTGVNIFSFDDINGYVAVEGDKVTVRGIVDQFNGLLEVVADTIIFVSNANPINAPTVVTTFDEAIESQFIKIENLTTVNGETAWPDGGNVDVTDGTTTFAVRVPSGSTLANAPIPSYFSLTGIGKQYDNSTPYEGGYQVFPCGIEDLCTISATATENAGIITATITDGSGSETYQWKSCADSSDVAGATGATFEPAQSGSYFVMVTDGNCTTNSACVTVNFTSVNNQEFAGINIYPNPVNHMLNIENSNTIKSIEIVSIAGRVVYNATVNNKTIKVNTTDFSAGVYFVKLRTANSESTFKVVK